MVARSFDGELRRDCAVSMANGLFRNTVIWQVVQARQPEDESDQDEEYKDGH